MYEREIEQLQEMIDASGHIVFFGGAGVSTACCITMKIPQEV